MYKTRRPAIRCLPFPVRLPPFPFSGPISLLFLFFAVRPNIYDGIAFGADIDLRCVGGFL